MLLEYGLRAAGDLTHIKPLFETEGMNFQRDQF